MPKKSTTPTHAFFQAASLACVLCVLMGGRVAYSQVPTGYMGKPYHDSAQVVPGRLQPERYDEGGNGVAWKDGSAGNTGKYKLRNPTDVDIDTVDTRDRTAAASTVNIHAGDAYLAWLDGNDWVKMTVDVKTSGLYNLSAYAGVAVAGASFSLEAFQGADSTGSGPVALALAPSACSVECYHYWNYLKNIGQINLKAGLQVIRLQITKVGYNFDYVDLDLADGTGIHDRSARGLTAPARGESTETFRGSSGKTFDAKGARRPSLRRVQP